MLLIRQVELSLDKENNSPVTIQKPFNDFLFDVVEKIGEGIGEEVVVFFVIVLAVSVRDFLIKKIEVKNLTNFYFSSNNLNILIREKMIEILQLIKADRVLLLQLHNGENYLSKMTKLKCSLTHQYTEKGIAPIDKIVDLPVTYIHRELDALRNTDDFYWLLKDDSFPLCRIYLENMGVECYGAKMIHNKLGLPIAIFGVHYCSFDFLPVMNDKKIQDDLTRKIKEFEQIFD